MRSLSLLAAALLLPACTGPYDGTWLFQLDPNTEYAGDCEPDSDAPVTEYFGTSNSFVDIYSTATNEIVVMMVEPLRGTAAGSELEASWEYGYETDDYAEQRSYDFSASVAANIMEGTIEYTLLTDSDGDDYECQTQNEFTAERVIDTPDTYAGN